MTAPTRFVCVHGHFYQPPRENPWIEAVELQESAAPYHDWNERIDAECYGPNAAARVLDDAGRIVRLADNYSRISFNVGPTLLSWLERHAPSTYEAILEADRASIRRYGRGSAMAQAYGHAILPLCNDRDRRTQVAWGIADFRKRFARDPEGLWLPETAVDTRSLETLAEFGIRFTVLAPSQARRFRAIGATDWSDGSSALDTRVPYRVTLPSGRHITVFFYDGATSRAVAFERLLDDGAAFVARIRSGFDDRDGTQLVHLATDGESYGHHHRFGEMALAFALDRLESSEDVTLVNYAAFLDAHPPADEAEIVEHSAWSCAHGVGRWTDDCGCRTGAHPTWSQGWRRPLREALDEVRDTVAPAWERHARGLLDSPWEARDAYVEVVLDRSPGQVERFLRAHAGGGLPPDRRREALELLELQRAMVLAYTSCGWFFDDVSGIETIQILQYAARALELARTRLGLDLEPRFLERLAEAPSNAAAGQTGRTVYERAVLPARVDLGRAAAHAIVGAMFDADGAPGLDACFEFEHDDWRVARTARPRHASGRVRVTDRRTGASDRFEAAAIHLGGPNLLAGVRRPGPDGASAPPTLEAVREALDRGEIATIVRQVESAFPDDRLSVGSLLRDVRRDVTRRLLHDALHDVEIAFERLYRQHAATLRMLAGSGVPLPGALRDTARFALIGALRRTLGERDPDPAEVRERVQEATTAGIPLEDPALRREAESALARIARAAHRRPSDPDAARRLLDLVGALEEVGADLHRTRVAVYGAPFPAGDPWDRLLETLGFAPGAGANRPN